MSVTNLCFECFKIQKRWKHNFIENEPNEVGLDYTNDYTNYKYSKLVRLLKDVSLQSLRLQKRFGQHHILGWDLKRQIIQIRAVI